MNDASKDLEEVRSEGPEVRLRDEITGGVLDPGRPVLWRRSVPLVADFELVQGERVFGEMEAGGGADVDAVGECLGRSLELRLRGGLLRGIRVKSTKDHGNEEGPSFQGLLFGWGRVGVSGGRDLRWRHSFSRMYDHVLIDSLGREVLRLRPAFLRFARTETRVLISSVGWGRPDVAELILLTWFLRVHADARGRRVFKKPRRPRHGD